MTFAEVSLSEFSLELFIRRRDSMDSGRLRWLESITDGEWKTLFATFVVLDALKADDLRDTEVLTAIRLAEQGQFAESSEYILRKLLAAGSASESAAFGEHLGLLLHMGARRRDRPS